MKAAFKKFNLSGKTALVTGGSAGLGYEMAKGLALSGATVMLAARRAEVLKEAANQLMEHPEIENVIYHSVDLDDRSSVQALADHANNALSGVDIFIGNAGLETVQPVDSLTNEAIDSQIRVNLSANMELTREFLPYMKKQQWGRIIFSSSGGSWMAGSDDMVSVYGASKSGLNGFARHVAAECGRDGITVNSLIIGVFLTEMLKNHLAPLDAATKKGALDAFSAASFAGRLGRVEEIAGLVQLLASDAGSFINGASIPIDGGLTASLRASGKPASEAYDF